MGTTTLGRSLKMLGYRNAGFNKIIWNYFLNDEIEKILAYTSKFDSFEDLPWLKEDMIPLLDRTFPGSRFIYLTRDEESWKASYSTWRNRRFGESPDIGAAWYYYRQHSEFVLDYFKDRDREHFITLDVRDENGFKKLADFLGKQTKRRRFPHYYKAYDENASRATRLIWRYFPKLLGKK